LDPFKKIYSQSSTSETISIHPEEKLVVEMVHCALVCARGKEKEEERMTHKVRATSPGTGKGERHTAARGRGRGEVHSGSQEGKKGRKGVQSLG